MAKFQVLTDLPLNDQQEITRIQAIASGQRNSVEVAYLANRSDYLYNGIDLKDADEDIVIAHGHTIPTGLSGFAKSSLFRKTDVVTGTKALYENVGDSDSASWDLVGQVSGLEAQIDEFAPVNAVNAFQTLTATTITQGIHAVSVITSDATNVAEDEVTVVGARTYRWRNTLAQVDDIKIGADAEASLVVLKKAINGTGIAGTDYFAGTVAHTLVTATTNTNTTQVIEYVTAGVIGNGLVAVSDTLTDGAWSDTTLAGGVNGTIGEKGQQYVSTSYLYTAIDDNGIADKNWRRVALGSVY